MECDKETLRLMEELTQAIGVSGQERQVCRILNRYHEALADEVVRDSNGSIYAVRHTDAPGPFRVMVAAHSDEVGMVVKQIKPNGLIKTSTIGGLWEDVLLGARLRLCTDDDREFRDVYKRQPYGHYHCSKYGQGTRQCSMHYIRYDVLYAYVLSRLQYLSLIHI